MYDHTDHRHTECIKEANVSPHVNAWHVSTPLSGLKLGENGNKQHK